MEVLTISCRKGGTGKSTTALNLGAYLHRSGKRILFVDMDSQCSLTRNLAADPENIPTVYEVLTKETNAAGAIISTAEGDLIASSPILAGADAVFTETGKEYRLKEALEPIRKRYDYIILDTAPALNIMLVNSLTASTGTIITAEPKRASLDGIAQLYESIKAVRKYTNKRLQIDGILITRANTRTTLTKDMIQNAQQIAGYLNTKVFNTVIRECSALAEAEAMQESIFQYAPRSNGAKDYKDLVKEILQNGE